MIRFFKRPFICKPIQVKVGDNIKIQSCRVKQQTAVVECIANSPETKALLVEIVWSNKTTEQWVLEYDGTELKHFHLLNKDKYMKAKEENLNELQTKLQELIESEKYEEAERMQAKIKKLSKR